MSESGAAAGYDEHYVDAVTRLGSRREIVLTEPLYSHSGARLLDRGARIDARARERLLQHRLAQPIEQVATVAEPVTAADLHAGIAAALQSSPLLARLVDADGAAAQVRAAIDACPLPAPMAFRLTVSREQRTDLYEHALRACAVVLALGCRAGFGPRPLREAAAVALYHDCGMLHVDPVPYEAGKRLSAAARRQLQAHPLTGMLILQKVQGIPAEVVAAVLEHHERLDGSGYPRGLRSDEISPLGRAMALAEVVLATIEAQDTAPQLRLSLILRLNHRAFDRGLVTHLARLLQVETPPREEAGASAAAFERIERLLRHWDDCVDALAAAGVANDAAAEFVGERVAALRRSLAEAGALSEPMAALWSSPMPEPQVMAELASLVREAEWQLRHIVAETLRRWPSLAPDGGPVAHSPVSEWLVHTKETVERG